MVYRVIGLMSGSSLDGLDLAFIELQETAGKWNYDIRHCACYPYSDAWKKNLHDAHHLSALDYQLLHTAYGHYLGELVNRFIEDHAIQYQVQLVASHGHTVFHSPSLKMTAQLGDGAAIAAVTGINVVSDLRAVDVALGGHGAPIVPIAEKLLLDKYSLFLNLGGIANISSNGGASYVAFDVCPANRVLNMLVASEGKSFDEGGMIAASGRVDENILQELNQLEYYRRPYPKSLANDFGTDTVFPIVSKVSSTRDALRTYVEHIAEQVADALKIFQSQTALPQNATILVTGGGAHNNFLVERISARADGLAGVEVPDQRLIDYKEAVAMALIGVLRWREENNVLASVTGASRNSIGGAVWIGQEA